MGVVYKAEDLRLQRPVALKFLPSGSFGDEEAKVRFLREARAAAALHHPNICTVHEIDEVDHRPFIVMAYLEGRELTERIAKGPLGLPQLLDVAIQIGHGLEEAHTRGVVHRDIKPANIMETASGKVVLMDFGLAQMSMAESRLTRAGMRVGTLSYMSPEQMAGDEVDHRTDIWSFGVVLYEMATGQLPFQGDYEQAVFYSILQEPPKPMGPDAPDELEPITRKCLAKRPEERYQTVSELLADLSALKRSRDSDPPSRASSGVSQLRPSIVVLPFQNRSRGEEDEYFADGVTEDVISTLGKIEGLRVIPRASAFHFKGKRPALHELVDSLRVSHVLEGSVRHAGERLRITVELIEAVEGDQVWTERYDRVMADIFDIQDELSRAIADALKTKLMGPPPTTPRVHRTENFDAYRLYLQGRRQFYQFSGSSFRQAISRFEAAAELDERYVDPHAGIADAYTLLGSLGLARPKEVFPKAREEALRALRLDETIAEAHAALALIQHSYDWDFAAAEQSFRRAIELDPASPTCRAHFCWVLDLWGRAEEGIEQGRAAVELDPLNPFMNRMLGHAYLFAGEYEAALAQLRKTLEIEPHYVSAMWEQANTLGLLGRPDEALQAIATAHALAPEDAINLGILGCYQAGAGRRAEAERTIEQLKAMQSERYVGPGLLSMVYLMMGDLDRGIEFLELGLEERDPLIQLTKHHPSISGMLKQDPRIERIVQRIGIP